MGVVCIVSVLIERKGFRFPKFWDNIFKIRELGTASIVYLYLLQTDFQFDPFSVRPTVPMIRAIPLASPSSLFISTPPVPRSTELMNNFKQSPPPPPPHKNNPCLKKSRIHVRVDKRLNTKIVCVPTDKCFKTKSCPNS